MIKLFLKYKKFQLKNKNIFFKKIFFLIKKEGKYEKNINYIFCNDKYILEMNKKYLKKDYYTDVLAFDFSYKKYISGDIYISTDRVFENSQIWKQSFIIELNRVMIHAILHFLGYSDSTELDKNIMNKKENFYLKLFSNL